MNPKETKEIKEIKVTEPTPVENKAINETIEKTPV